MTPPSCPAIMIVAAKLEVRCMIRLALAKVKLPTLEATTAEQALQILSSHPDEIALVITDLVMPHMGGLDLANKIRVLQPNIKMLYISDNFKVLPPKAWLKRTPESCY